jgi:hypothetical protein
MVGEMCGAEADEVRDVLAEGESAVDAVTGQGLVGVVLLDQEGGLPAILGVVRRRPPVAQSALGVVLPALGVEAVADIVADHRPDRPVVHRVLRPGSKKGGRRMAAGTTISLRERA